MVRCSSSLFFNCCRVTALLILAGRAFQLSAALILKKLCLLRVLVLCITSALGSAVCLVLLVSTSRFLEPLAAAHIYKVIDYFIDLDEIKPVPSGV